MSCLKYRGYQGSVEFDDGQLVIQALHMSDLLITQCISAEDVEDAFKCLIDDYLEFCSEIGRDPEKPYKGSFNVRMAPETHKTCARMASVEGVTLNAWVVKTLEEKISRLETRPSDFWPLFVTSPDRSRADYEVLTARSYSFGEKNIRRNNGTAGRRGWGAVLKSEHIQDG